MGIGFSFTQFHVCLLYWQYAQILKKKSKWTDEINGCIAQIL